MPPACRPRDRDGTTIERVLAHSERGALAEARVVAWWFTTSRSADRRTRHEQLARRHLLNSSRRAIYLTEVAVSRS